MGVKIERRLLCSFAVVRGIPSEAPEPPASVDGSPEGAPPGHRGSTSGRPEGPEERRPEEETEEEEDAEAEDEEKKDRRHRAGGGGGSGRARRRGGGGRGGQGFTQRLVVDPHRRVHGCCAQSVDG
eukprot:4764608-Pyramimonas_sp.AAC.1